MTAMYVTDQKDGWLHYIHTQDQEDGWLLCIHNEPAECEQEVGPDYKSSRPVPTSSSKVPCLKGFQPFLNTGATWGRSVRICEPLGDSSLSSHSSVNEDR